MFPSDSSQLLTDRLLSDASSGLDSVSRELIGLYDQWLRAGVDARSTDWLATLIGVLGWWSGRLLGGVSDDSPLSSCR